MTHHCDSCSKRRDKCKCKKIKIKCRKCKCKPYCPKPCPQPCPPRPCCPPCPPPCPLPNSTIFKGRLNGCNEVPPNNSVANGTFIGLLPIDQSRLDYVLQTNGLSSAIIEAGVYEGACGTYNASPPLFPISINPQGAAQGSFDLSATNLQKLKSGLLYVNIKTANFPNGEIRDQIWPVVKKH